MLPQFENRVRMHTRFSSSGRRPEQSDDGIGRARARPAPHLALISEGNVHSERNLDAAQRRDGLASPLKLSPMAHLAVNPRGHGSLAGATRKALERALFAVLAVVAEDFDHVVLRFLVRGDTAVAHDGAFTRVVCGDGQLNIAVEQVG